MQLFQKQVRNQIKETRDLLDRIQQFQKTVPKGSLIITHKQKKVYYKWQYHDENLKCIRKYLSKKEMKQIQMLGVCQVKCVSSFLHLFPQLSAV